MKREVKTSQDEIKHHFKEVAATESGKEVLRWFMKECGFKEPVLALTRDTGEISVHNTVYNVSKRDVWIQARTWIPVKMRNVIESDKEDKR